MHSTIHSTKHLTFKATRKSNTRGYSTQKLRLVLVGPPGCGKGTQSAKLQKQFGVTPISTGHMLRTEVLEKTPLGLHIEGMMKSGSLVPDEVMLNLVKQTLSKKEIVGSGWVLDGFPRTQQQATNLRDVLKELSQPLTAVLYLSVSEHAIYERIKDRWVHLPSGRDYNTVYKPPKVPGLDDVTGEPLVKRNDDTLETVRERLRSYREATMPVMKVFEDAGLLHTIDSPTSDVGYVHILKLLSQFGFNPNTTV